jgi:hypothetical protein
MSQAGVWVLKDQLSKLESKMEYEERMRKKAKMGGGWIQSQAGAGSLAACCEWSWAGGPPVVVVLE